MRIANTFYNAGYNYIRKAPVNFKGNSDDKSNEDPKAINHEGDILIRGKAIPKKKAAGAAMIALAPVIAATYMYSASPKKDAKTQQDATVTTDYQASKKKAEGGSKPKTNKKTAPADDKTQKHIYTVKDGDSLSSIVRDYLDEDTDWVTVERCINRLAADNNIANNGIITPGAAIDINFLDEIALLRNEQYTIKDGDTLSSIVRSFTGDNTSWAEVEDHIQRLLEANPAIEGADNIKPNQKIDIKALTSGKTFEELVSNYALQSENNVKVDSDTSKKPSESIKTENTGMFKQTEEEKTSGTVKFKSFERSEDKAKLSAMATANVQEFIPVKKGELTGKTIMINAGHGGVTPANMLFDGGAINNNDEEYTYAAEYSEALAQKLLDKGAKVVILQGSVYTLTDPINNFAKENAKNIDDTAFISLHFDAFDNKAIKGASVFYQGNESSRPFARTVYDSMKNAGIDFINGQPIERNLLVTRVASSNECNIDNSILVECGTISNSSDLANIKSKDYKNKLTDSLAQAIIKSF